MRRKINKGGKKSAHCALGCCSARARLPRWAASGACPTWATRPASFLGCLADLGRARPSTRYSCSLSWASKPRWAVGLTRHQAGPLGPHARTPPGHSSLGLLAGSRAPQPPALACRARRPTWLSLLPRRRSPRAVSTASSARGMMDLL